MIQILAIIQHDLKLYFSDRRALIMLFVVPIGIASFTGSLFGGSGGKGTVGGGLEILVVDQDASAVSRGVVAAFNADPTFRVTLTNEAAARALVLNGKRSVALLLPKGLGADALPGFFNGDRRPILTLLHDPSRRMEASVVEGMLVPKVIQSVARNALSPEQAGDFVRQALTNLNRTAQRNLPDRQLYRELLERSEKLLATRRDRPLFGAVTGGPNTGDATGFTFPLPFAIQTEALTRGGTGEYNGYAHSFAGMGLQFVLMCLLDFAIGLLRERESGMFRRLRVAPLARGTLLLGKGLSLALISVLSLIGCFAFAMVVFRVRVEGSWPGFLACLVATSMMASSLALAIAAIGKTPAGTRSIGIAVTLLLLMVGGAWVPVFVFPQWLQKVSLVTPTRWAVDGFDAMTWRGLGFEAAITPVAVMLGFTALFAALTWARLHWDAE